MAKKPVKTTKKTEKASKKKSSPSKKKKQSYDEDDDMATDVKSNAVKNKNRYGSQLYNLPEGTENFQAKKGTFKLDHVPYRITDKKHPSGRTKGKLWYERTYYIHYGVGPNEEPVICPTSIGRPCPVCEKYRILVKSGDKNDEKEAETIKRKERQMFNVINLDDQDKGVQFFNISVHNYGVVLEEEIRESEDESSYARFAQLKGGSTLEVRFKEASMGSTKFPKASRIDFIERDDYDKDILDEVINLDEVLIIKPYDELDVMVNGEIDEDEEEETPRNKKSSSKKKNRDEDEDEDEDEEEEEEEEEEDKDEEDEDEDEEEEEEEKPSKNKKKSSSKNKSSSKKKSSKKEGKKKKKKCPAGGTFGEDCDDYDECGDCDYWVECSEMSDED